MSGDEAGFDRDRAELHEALSHPTRVRILQILARSPLGFSDLRREAGMESGGLLVFHLDKLGGLVKAEEGKYALTERGKEALGMAAGKAQGAVPPRVACTNCGALMESYGRQMVRMGDFTATGVLISLTVFPDVGAPMPFETYICPGCGKVALFADKRTRKMLKGEFPDDDYFVACPKCQRKYAGDIEKCPYCGEVSPRFRGGNRAPER